VIIPTYNRAGTIRRAIDSVLGQSYKELELIIVDDCSSDNTVQIIHSYHDKRIHLICLSENGGANVARNKGIRAAKGEYIAFQDSDDEWLEDKLAVQVDYMDRAGKKVCYCQHTLITEMERIRIPEQTDQKEIYEEKITDVLRKWNVISTQTLVIHKEVVEKIGMFDETMKRLQDYEFVIRICQKYDIAYIDRPLVNVYRMKECISNDKKALADALGRILVRHIDFMDFESVRHLYLYYCEWYDADGINMQWIDTVLGALHDAGKIEKLGQIVKMKENMAGWYDFFSKNIIGKKFVIYGAGGYGKKTYSILKKIGAVPECFWVTYNQQEKDIDGIPVLRIPDRAEARIPVVVSVSREKQGELVDNLLSRGMVNYYIYPLG
jgi:glycosyltransferase involved in cell wall biosynthesis